MQVVGLRDLQKLKNRHADVKAQVDAWLSEVEIAKWDSPQDIKLRYPSASILSDNQVVFNLKGNNYRVLVKIDYKRQTILVKKAGTHAEYSRWNLN